MMVLGLFYGIWPVLGLFSGQPHHLDGKFFVLACAIFGGGLALWGFCPGWQS